jgi:hypothetical protein
VSERDLKVYMRVIDIVLEIYTLCLSQRYLYTLTQDILQFIRQLVHKIQSQKSDTRISFSKYRDCHTYHLVSREKLYILTVKCSYVLYFMW